MPPQVDRVDCSEESAALQLLTRATDSMGASLETFETPPVVDKISKEGTSKHDSSSITSVRRPWWKRGGMHRNITGMAINIFIPFFFMASHIPDSPVVGHFSLRAIFYTAVLSAIALSYVIGMRTLYCIVVVPTCFTSYLLCFWALPTVSEIPPILVWIAANLVLSTLKGGICMSICLHRYAAHAAFTCGPTVRFIYFIGGCLANQGGPIWWAANHRAHHKYCDTEGDPHSPMISGVERAFAFFMYKARVVDEFVPSHLDNEFLWFLDTWSFAVHSAELYLAYLVGGLPGLYVAWQSAFVCQAVTLWFNVINHPTPEGHVITSNQARKEDMREVCVASDCIPSWPQGCFLPPGAHMAGGYLPFHILNSYYFFLIRFVYEGYHKHHHEHSRLAQRAPFDFTYMLAVYPLEKLGLVWNVHHYPKEAKKER